MSDPWFDDWGVDMLQMAHMFTSREMIHATAALSTKERMNELLF